MKSEINQGYEVQVRVGQVTMDSYLFFPREFGDLLIEPGDELILVVRHSKRNGNLGAGSWIGDSRFFEKVNNTFTSVQVMDRLKQRPSSDPWQTLKEAINKARDEQRILKEAGWVPN